MPVTFEAAENEPIFSGRSAYCVQLGVQFGRVDVAVGVLGDRHDVGDRLAPGSSLEWCSNGPMNTTGRSSAGM